ncbi:site-specific integrase [Glutamicibacter creatinolyticus]
MAWIEKRKRKDGGTTFYVIWREPGSTEKSKLTIRDDEESAKMNVRLLEANNNSYEAARRAMENASIGGQTVREYIEKHIGLLTRAGEDQLKRYERAIRNHFSGDLGKTPLAAARQEDVIRWIRYMQGKGLSPKTIANHHGLLSAAMKRAHDTGVIALNPCAGVQLPEDNRVEESMRFMTVDESLRVVLAHPERYQPLVAFLRGTGARFGEATALRGKDFSLDAKQPSVRIEKAWKRGKDNRFYIGPPKTKKSRRTVSLPPSLVEFIRPNVEQAGDHGLVFVTSYGGAIRHSTFFEFWKGALDKLGYPAGERPRIHDMRHTHASIMLSAGLDMYVLSRRLGHESIQTTVDRYSHLLPDAQFEAAKVAENALGSLPSRSPHVGELVDDDPAA